MIIGVGKNLEIAVGKNKPIRINWTDESDSPSDSPQNTNETISDPPKSNNEMISDPLTPPSVAIVDTPSPCPSSVARVVLPTASWGKANDACPNSPSPPSL